MAKFSNLDHKKMTKGQMTESVGWIPRHLETMKGVKPTKRFGELEKNSDPEIPE